MIRTLLAALLLTSCALTPDGPTSLVRGTVQTEGDAIMWSDGTALVVVAPALVAGVESKAPDVYQLPPQTPAPQRYEGVAWMVRFYPFETTARVEGEAWPVWARGTVPVEWAEEMGVEWDE